MAPWGKREKPIDRAVRELESQIAQVRRQLRQAEPPADAKPAPTDTPGPAAKESVGEPVGKFIKQMIGSTRQRPSPTHRARKDLFDVVDTPLDQLETDAIAFGPKPEPDLFTATPATEMQSGAAQTRMFSAMDSEKLSAQGSKLVHYLSAGSIKSYKPLRRVQREERNRFFAYMGLAIGALWLIYVIVR